MTAKSSIRTYSNSRGEGKLFNVTLVDETGEIRATMFKEVVDKFYDLLEVNQVQHYTVYLPVVLIKINSINMLSIFL